VKKEVLICQDKLGYEGGNFILEKGIRLKGLKEHWIGNRDKSLSTENFSCDIQEK